MATRLELGHRVVVVRSPPTGYDCRMTETAAVLLDIDGCIVRGIGREALPGAPRAVARLRRERPVRFVTNTTSRTREWLVESLGRAGFELDRSEVVTPTALARRVLTSRGEARGVLLVADTGLADLEWFVPTPPEEARAVLVASEVHDMKVGDLREAVTALRGGARLYTLQQNRVFHRDGRLLTDLGPVAAFLGHAADVEWENLGKPSPLLFEALAAELGCWIDEMAMVGDERRYSPAPSLVIDSIADLPDLL